VLSGVVSSLFRREDNLNSSLPRVYFLTPQNAFMILTSLFLPNFRTCIVRREALADDRYQSSLLGTAPGPLV